MDLQNTVYLPLKDTTLLLNGSLPDPIKPVHEFKVRKPYTISKQREKWSEEEHQKFLDALKLHGRAWRQIQEFIGTKTAVQIRSHAQKFFSKVVQGGNDNTESRIADIEIPPPRPKRKPTHPYPRKYVDPQNVVGSSSFQPEKRSCSNFAIADSENQSPNSVLSPSVTQTLEFPVSELPDSCLSNSSCSTGTQSGSLFCADREDNSKAINRSASSTVENSANKHIRLPEMEADLPEASIMLFGQIVSTKDSKRPSTARSNNFTPPKQRLAVSGDDKYEKREESPASSGLNVQLPLGLHYGNWKPWSLNGMNSSSTCASPMQWMPIPVYTGLPPPFFMPYSQKTASPFVGERTCGKELCDTRVKDDSTEETKHEVYESRLKLVHKRCSATAPIDSANMEAEEDGQQVRLCL